MDNLVWIFRIVSEYCTAHFYTHYCGSQVTSFILLNKHFTLIINVCVSCDCGLVVCYYSNNWWPTRKAVLQAGSAALISQYCLLNARTLNTIHRRLLLQTLLHRHFLQNFWLYVSCFVLLSHKFVSNQICIYLYFYVS